MMDGDPDDPMRESWGGSFRKIGYSPRKVLDQTTSTSDTVAFCSILEFRFRGPEMKTKNEAICFWMDVPYGKTVQRWPGYYLGDGVYGIRYIPKKAEVLNYKFVSEVPAINGKTGTVVVSNLWPGKQNKTDYKLGNGWYTDKPDQDLYDGKIQGGKTVSKWRDEILSDWAKRWAWLNE